MVWTVVFAQDKESCYELGNEPSGSVKCWEVLEWPHDWAQLHGVSAFLHPCTLILH
jgi:hypothetical protein